MYKLVHNTGYTRVASRTTRPHIHSTKCASIITWPYTSRPTNHRAVITPKVRSARSEILKSTHWLRLTRNPDGRRCSDYFYRGCESRLTEVETPESGCWPLDASENNCSGSSSIAPFPLPCWNVLIGVLLLLLGAGHCHPALPALLFVPFQLPYRRWQCRLHDLPRPLDL